MVYYPFCSAIFPWSPTTSCGFQAYELLQLAASTDVKSEMNTGFRKLLLKVC